MSAHTRLRRLTVTLAAVTGAVLVAAASALDPARGESTTDRDAFTRTE